MWSYEILHVRPILHCRIGQTCKISYDEKKIFFDHVQ